RPTTSSLVSASCTTSWSGSGIAGPLGWRASASGRSRPGRLIREPDQLGAVGLDLESVEAGGGPDAAGRAVAVPAGIGADDPTAERDARLGGGRAGSRSASRWRPWHLC